MFISLFSFSVALESLREIFHHGIIYNVLHVIYLATD